jgi:hypothetical protein
MGMSTGYAAITLSRREKCDPCKFDRLDGLSIKVTVCSYQLVSGFGLNLRTTGQPLLTQGFTESMRQTRTKKPVAPDAYEK